MIQLTAYQRALINQHRHCFTNTGGNNVEEVLERKVSMETNMPLAVIQSMVLAQLQMLERLVESGALRRYTGG